MKYELTPIPIRAGTKPAACKRREYRATDPTADELRVMFLSAEAMTVGVLGGTLNGRLLVLERDPEAALTGTLEALGHPDTWVVRSPRGRRVYLLTPVPVRSVLSSSSRSVHVLGQRRYVLAPGAVHPNGSRYQLTREAHAILEPRSLDLMPGLLPARAGDGAVHSARFKQSLKIGLNPSFSRTRRARTMRLSP